jgi:ferredoxin-NADP reductase
VATAAVRRRLTWEYADVVDVRAETARAWRLTLQVPGWTGHRPGQHLDVRLTAEDGYTAQRSYSIASGPAPGTVQLVVDRLPDGEVSPYLTEVLRPGDELEVRGPLGGYFVWDGAEPGPVQLVAGGSGVVPFLSIIEHHRATGGDAPVHLLYSARSLEDVVARDRLDPAPAGVHVTLALTRTSPPGWTGLTGRVDRDVLSRHSLPASGRPRVMVCGPTAFVEVVAGHLVALGHRPEDIRTERFGPSGGTP